MKKFNMIDDEFTCEHCHQKISKLNYSARDHCNHCLYSKHVDINPGDRASTCHGLLVPTGIEKFKDTYKIIYKCDKCGIEHKNIMANDDSMDEIIKLSVNNK